jgi:beta-lactamase superfamily II metal-dependent hydrolase
MPDQTTVTVRMYNVGFGDCFLITITRGVQVWRMLVDCGVHSQGHATINGVTRNISDVVQTVIADLTALAPAGSPPHLDVVVATHHHQDHISGFAVDEWTSVDVGQVLVPFVEDANDPDAQALRNGLVSTAAQIHGVIEARANAKSGNLSAPLALANSLALNSMGNAKATDRLLSRNGTQFKNTPPVTYVPDLDPAKNVIALPIEGVRIHLLGPSRDPKQLALMDPPASAQWLQLDPDQNPDDDETPTMFAPIYVVADEDIRSLPSELTDARASLRLTQLSTDDDALLEAAAVLERSVNNTSVYFVLDVAGTRLLFVGDSQEGAWQHVLDDPAAKALVSNVAFYKIGHHGSHNATPKPFVESVLGDGAYAMLPWGLVKRWQDTIPKAELLTALAQHNTHLVRADAPVAAPHEVDVDPGLLWSQVTFTV